MNGTDRARELCYQAMASPRGIAISTSNVDSSRSLISAARRGNPDLADLVIKLNPKAADELWIIKVKRQVAATPPSAAPTPSSLNDLGL